MIPIEIGDPAGGSRWLDPTLPAGSRIHTESGELQHVVQEGVPPLSELEAAYFELLQDAASHLGREPRAAELALGHPFVLGSCGPAALLMLAHLEGKAWSYEFLLSRLPSDELNGYESSLASLGFAAGEMGLPVRAVRVGVAGLDREWGPLLAWVEGGPFESSHFVLALQAGDGYVLHSPPHQRYPMTDRQFEEIYQGVVLVPESRYAKEPGEGEDAAVVALPWMGSKALLGLLALAGLAAVAGLFRRRGRAAWARAARADASHATHRAALAETGERRG